MAKSTRNRSAKSGRTSPGALVITSVDPVNITSASWVFQAMMWQFQVVVQATIQAPTDPAGASWICTSKTAKIQKKSGAIWVDVTGETPMTAVGTDLFEATFVLPQGVINVGDVIRGYSRATWQGTLTESGNSASSTVPAHP